MLYCGQPDFLASTLLPIVVTALATMLFVLSLAYMAGHFFRKQEYEGFVSIELHQLLISTILISSVLGLSMLFCEIYEAYAGGDPFQIGQDYLYRVSNGMALQSLLGLESLKIAAQFYGSGSISWGLSVWGATHPLFPSFIVLERLFDFLLMLIMPLVSSLMVQKMILGIINAVAIAFVLPIGAILRIFPPTRDAGSFMIASAIGFYFIYPFTYVMHNQISLDMENALEGEIGGFAKVMNARGYTHLTPLILLQKGAFNIDVLLYKPLRVIGLLILEALFLPALSMIITVAFIKSLAKFIGQKMG